MPKSSVNASLSSYDDIFSTEESRQEEQREQVRQIPIGELFPFKNHPFKVLDDDSMSDTVESVKQYGVLSPLIARPRPKGGYEIISGHRRQHAAELAGLETLPVIVRQMDDDAAIILMVDSNLQREHILPSERAFAYKMKLDAMKNQGTRSDLTSTQVVSKLRSNEKLGAENNQSRETVRRFIRLTNLIPELLDMVDNKTVSFNPAVELSYLSPEQQQEVIRAMDDTQNFPSVSQAKRIKKLAQDGTFTTETVVAIMGEEKKSELDTVTIKNDTLRKYFPRSYLPVPEAKFETVVVKPSEIQQDMVKSLSERAAEVHSGAVDPSVDNMLKITSDGRKIGLDQRLMNPLTPDDPDSKLNACVDNVLRIWNETKEDNLTQLIFCDMSTPKGDGSFNVYDDIRTKLLAAGVPESEVEFIHNADTEGKKADLFSKVRSGKVRVLLGSTAKMGAGTNVQTLLVAVHHLDVGWRPSDMTQRNGRIIRQGNKNKQVYVYARSELMPDLQIVPQEQFENAQRIRNERSVRSTAEAENRLPLNIHGKSLLAGNAYCGHCGAKLELTSSRKWRKMADGSLDDTLRIRYTCYGKLRKQTNCTGQTGYTVHILDEIIDKAVRQIFSKMRGIPKEQIVTKRYEKENAERKNHLQDLQTQRNKAEKDLFALKTEVLACIKGESVLPRETLAEMITAQEEKLTELENLCEAASEELEKTAELMDKVSRLYDELISYADLYDSANFEAKKMIVNQLIRRVDVYRGYQINISFNFDLTPYIEGE